MTFQQTPPALGNQYEDDRVLRSYLARVLPGEMLREIESSLKEIGELSGGELYKMQLEDRLNEPKLTQWDAWGNRVDEIELTPLWRKAERICRRARCRCYSIGTEVVPLLLRVVLRFPALI